MDIRRLRYFVAVAEEGHITRAAERIGMQQPPLSQQIKLLEDELQSQLFRRTPKGVELTDAGQTLYDDAVRILGALDRAAAKVLRTARGERGRIVFGFTHATAFHRGMLNALSGFHSDYPEVELAIVEATTGELVEEVRAATIDVAMVRSHVANRDDIVIHDLEQEAMIVALPSDHALAAQAGAIDLADLAGAPVILYRRATSPGLYDAIIGAFRSLKVTPWIAQETSNVIASVSLVSAGFG
ncbi:MAG: LysR family transcriptional regulator, partial [Pseudomonadota bacterium]